MKTPSSSSSLYLPLFGTSVLCLCVLAGCPQPGNNATTSDGDMSAADGGVMPGRDLGQDAGIPGEDMRPPSVRDMARDGGAGTEDMGVDAGHTQDMTGDMPGDCSPGVEVPDRLVCNPDDLEYLYTVDECGDVLARSSTRCYGSKKCEEHATTGQAFCSCPLTGNLTCKASKSQYPQSLVDDTYVVKERECSNGPELDPADIVETCGFGSVCFVDDYDETPHMQRNDGQAFCARSTNDTDSPYYDFACGSGFTEFMRYPTDLEVDCRCRVFAIAGSQENGGTGTNPADPNDYDVSVNPDAHPLGSIMNCKAPTTIDLHDWPVPYGQGPVFKDFNDGMSTWYGAEFDPQARELYSLVLWGDSTYTRTATVVAWNVDTKDRRVVTGILPDSVSGYMSNGSGYESPNSLVTVADGVQPLTQADVIRLASDGNLYVSSAHEIVRVDPATGARTLVWKRQDEALTGDISATYGQCFRPDRLGVKDGLQLEKVSFEIGPNLEFYKGFRDGRGGNGILKISADGSTCEVLFRWGDEGDPDNTGGGAGVPAAPDIGTGPDLQRFPVQGMLHHAGKIYAVSNNELVEFDPDTLTYRRVDDPNVPTSIGYTSMFWDAGRGVIWASGDLAQVFGGSVIDPVTGQNELIVSDTGVRTYPGRELLRSVYPGGGSAANTGGGATSNQNRTQMGGVILDPLDDDIAYGVTNTGALLKFELSTFNNYIHSWGQH